MGAVSLPPPPLNAPLADGGGVIANPWRLWVMAVYRTLYADGYDKVDAAYTVATAAASATTPVVGAGGLQGGGALNDGAGVRLYAALDLAANLPTTGLAQGDWAYAFDGRKPGEAAGHGTGVPCFWSNGVWNAVTTGVPVTT